MSPTFDIVVLPLHRRDGHDQPYLPGLHVASPPRRPARGRHDDRLILFLALEGELALSQDQQTQILETLAREYYRIPGTVTSALRSLAENLNQFLLKRNLRGAKRGRQAVGLLTMAVARDDRLYLAQSGPVHGFLLSADEIRHWHDPQSAGRGLGLSRSAPVYFSQTELKSGALVVLTSHLPEGWGETTLREAYGQNLSTLRRRFLSHAGTDLAAVVIQARPGRGGLRLVRSPEKLEALEGKPAREEGFVRRPSPAAPAPKPAPERASRAESPSRPARKEPDPRAWEPLASPAAEAPASEEPPRTPTGPAPRLRRARPAPRFGPAALDMARRLGDLSRRAGESLRALLARVLPGEGLAALPTPYMALTAIAVPLVVVTIAMVVYLRVGREQQYQAYLQQAQSAAQRAQTQSELPEARASWETALFYLDKAEGYQQTAESQQLRLQVRDRLDEMDGVERLDYQPAIAGSLGGSVQVTRMVATGTDLYMLDSASGNVLRAWLTGTGYELDAAFSCGPGPYGDFIVGPLVDIAALPKGNQQGADILAMDANGNLLYCIPEEPPLAAPLIPPDSNWGSPTAMTVENGNLHVLDPLTNAVWIYFGEDDAFPEPPLFFFGNEVPTLAEAIDLAVNGEDLYVLHADGHMTICNFSNNPEALTRCTDPAAYSDSRQGREGGVQIPDANFLSMARTPPPEPSIYMLDPISQSIYHFSLRLNLVRLYRSLNPLPGELATAFAVSPNRSVFLALGDEVFVAFLP